MIATEEDQAPPSAPFQKNDLNEEIKLTKILTAFNFGIYLWPYIARTCWKEIKGQQNS